MTKSVRFTRLLLFSFFFIFLFSIFFAPKSFAQNFYAAPDTNPDVPRNLHTWTQNVMIEVMAASTCQLIGIDPINPDQKCLGIDPQTKKIGFVEGGGGAVGMMGTMIAMLYTPPIHGFDYFDYLAGNFGLAKPAYAQSQGISSLFPIARMWQAFLNIVYLLLVIVFIFIGLAIMLRLKIDPRTVMTIENQLPKIVIGLIVATLSFAIAGFLIDLMYVIIYVIFNIFSNNNLYTPESAKGVIDKIQNTQKTFNSDNPFGVLNNLVGFRELVTYAAGGVKDIVQNLFGTSVSLDLNAKDENSIWLLTGAVKLLSFVKDHTLNFFGAVLGWIAGALALLIISIAVLWALFKLWFELIKAYVYILIGIVFSPFWILLGMFPGSPLGFGAWIREMISNLLVFPVTIVMFMLGKAFMDGFTKIPTAVYPFTPPLIGNPGNPNALGSLIGLGIILITPQVLNMAKDYLKTPQFKYTAAIGQAVSQGASSPGRLVGGVGTLAFGGAIEKGFLEDPAAKNRGLTGRFLRAFGFLR